MNLSLLSRFQPSGTDADNRKNRARPLTPARSPFLLSCAGRLGMGAAAALLAAGIQAQETGAPAAPAASAAASAPRYAASDLERAFGFMDGNGDGKVSRQEASGFRGVAKNFDRADTNHDGVLSRQEFDTAMNYVKAK